MVSEVDKRNTDLGVFGSDVWRPLDIENRREAIEREARNNKNESSE